MVLLIILAIVLIVILGSLKQINEYERGVKFTAGKFTKIMLPGWRIVLPIFQSYKKVDIRTKVDDVPEQEAITKDNVSVKINAVIYYKVFDASLAVLEVEDFYYATAQLAQTTMRNIVGSVTLDELLCEREKVSSQIILNIKVSFFKIKVSKWKTVGYHFLIKVSFTKYQSIKVKKKVSSQTNIIYILLSSIY